MKGGPGVQLRDSGCLLRNFVSEELPSQVISPQASYQFQASKHPLKKDTSTSVFGGTNLVGLQTSLEFPHNPT